MINIYYGNFFGNPLIDYVIALGIFIAGIIIVKIFEKILLKKLKVLAEKTTTTVDDFIVAGIEKSAVPLLYFASLFIAVRYLTLSETAKEILFATSTVIVTFYVIKLITSSVRYGLDTYMSQRDYPEERKKQMMSILIVLNLLVYSLGLVFLLDNFGFNVAAVIAGLGIGGIAIALAAQALLGDMFSYFVIFFDKPFEIGDFIIVGDKLGVIEKIGIKTTRVRSLGGEQMIFPNSDLTSSRIHNYKRMERRRVLFKIGVVYQTKAAVLKEISELGKQIIEEQSDTTFDRGHFASYGDFSLVFEFVYYVMGNDYNKFMDVQQAINLRIYEEFEKRNIEFAYPTQTLYFNREENDNIKSEIVE